MAMVGDDDGGEPPSRRKRPGASILKVGLDKIDTGLASEIGHAVKVPVDSGHQMTRRSEQAEVTATAAGDVEHGAARSYQRREAAHPRGRFKRVAHSDAAARPFVLVY